MVIIPLWNNGIIMNLTIFSEIFHLFYIYPHTQHEILYKIECASGFFVNLNMQNGGNIAFTKSVVQILPAHFKLFLKKNTLII